MRFIKDLLYVSLTVMLFAGCGLKIAAIRSVDTSKKVENSL